MSLLTRLLTFDRLPNRQLIGDLSPFTEVYERLDSTTAFFENYYLQSAGVQSFVGNIDTMADINKLLVDHGLSAMFAAVGAPSNSDTNIAVPDWFQKHAVNHPTGLASIPEDCGLVWMHCYLEMQQNSADADVATMEQCLQTMRELAPNSDSPLIITGLNGVSIPAIFPFETRMFEGLIRTPLWVETSENRCSRIQGLAGSFDVLQTVRQNIQPDVAEGSPTTECSQPTSLMPLIANAGLPYDRELTIQTANANAIRTQSFLFVQSNTVSSINELNLADCALYSKPADVWNVHDVSAEYHEIVNAFSQQILQRTI